MVDFCGSRGEALRTGGLTPHYSVEVEMQTGVRKTEESGVVMEIRDSPEDCMVNMWFDNDGGCDDGFDDIVDLWVRRAFRHSEEV